MSSNSSIRALGAVQRFVDEHSAEYIMSLHAAAAHVGDDRRLHARLVEDVATLMASPVFCEELAANMVDACPDSVAAMLSKDARVRHAHNTQYV